MKSARMTLRVLLTAAVVCASVVPAMAADTLARILQKGELVVGTAGDMPPFNMTTKDGKLIGLEPDLARFMANAMGVKPKIATMPFKDLLPALEAGKVDMVMSQMTITPQRNLKVAFVGPYFISGKAFLTKQSTIANAKKGSDVNKATVTLATLKESTSQYFVQLAIPEAKLLTTNTYDEAVKLVLDDKADAMVADYPVCVVSVFRYTGKGLVSVITPLTYEPIGIAVPAGDAQLINWVENFLNAAQGSGELEALTKRWMGQGDWLKELP